MFTNIYGDHTKGECSVTFEQIDESVSLPGVCQLFSEVDKVSYYTAPEDMDGMKKEAELVRDLGFTGKGSIHPKQINVLNEIFTPSKEEISKAKKIVDQFSESDTGLVVIDGKLIEKPVLREMQRKILIADKINQS